MPTTCASQRLCDAPHQPVLPPVDPIASSIASSSSSATAPTRWRWPPLVPEPLVPAGRRGALRVHTHARLDGLRRLHRKSGQVIPRQLSKAAAASTCTACTSTMTRRSPAGARSGASRRSSAARQLRVDKDTLLGTLDYGSTFALPPAPWATSTAAPTATPCCARWAQPNWLLKIMPDVDCSPRVCELVEYRLEDVDAQGRLGRPGGPAALRARPGASGTHCRCLQVLGGLHLSTDLTLGLGRVVHDYLGR
jgi:acetoacetate decarboxylase